MSLKTVSCTAAVCQHWNLRKVSSVIAVPVSARHPVESPSFSVQHAIDAVISIVTAVQADQTLALQAVESQREGGANYRVTPGIASDRALLPHEFENPAAV